MAIFVSLRPDLDVKKVGIVLSTGTNAAALVDDGGNVPDYTGADDNTYIRAPAGAQYPNTYYITHLNDLAALAANQRIKQLRIRARVRMHTAVANDAAIVHAKLTDPQSGLGIMPVGTDVQSTGIDKFEASTTTVVGRTGAWHPKPPPLDGNEWSRAMVNRLRLELAWYYGNFGSENLRVTEAYVDVDVRTRPTVSTVTAAGQDATTRPTISWAYNPNVDGDPQIAYRVKVFSSAQYGAAGFNPDTSTATWDSGTRFGSGEQAQVGRDLLNGGTYKAYVWAAQDFNGDRWWTDEAGSSAFTVGLNPPPAPTLSVTSDATVPNLRNVLQFTATLNALAYDDADFEGGVGNWLNYRGTATQSTAQARHGAASLAMTADGTNPVFVINDGTAGAGAVAVRPGQQYTLSGWIRANTTTRAWRLVARYTDAATSPPIGNYVGQDNGATVTDSNSAWTALPNLTVTIPAGVTRLYFQAETTVTPANGEVHYLDQLQIVPGPTAITWAPGLLNTAYAVIEAAIAGGRTRNLAGRQLYGGGDDTRNASGFYTSGTSSVVAYDMLDRVRGIGSVRWEVEDAATKLYFGWPAGTLEDPSPVYALAAVPGRVYTFSVYLRATTPFSSQLNLQAINATGATVGAASNGGAVTVGTTWARYTATITAPAGAVYVRPHLDNTAGVTGRKVWVDAAQWELSTTATDLVRPSGLTLDWVPVRGFTLGKTAVPGGTQSLVAMDHEVPPGYTVIYRAWIFAFDPLSGQPLASPLTAYVPTLVNPPGAGQWVLSEVAGAPFLRGKVNVLPGLAYSQAEDVTVYHPLRPRPSGQVGQRPVALSDWIGGHDGTVQVAALSDDDFWLLERLLASQDPLWLTESQGGGRYIRLTDRAWTRTRFRDKCINLADGTRLEADEWEQVLTLQYVEAERPPDNETAVLFGVEPASTSPGGEEPPPAGELVYPGAATNWIDTAGGCCNSSSVGTVGGVLHDFGGNAGCNTAGSAPFNPAGTYSQWGIAGTFRRLEWKLRIDDDEVGEGHFWALESQFQSSPEIYYAGFQRGSNLVTNPPGKLALFSVWSAVGAVAGTAAGAVAAPFTETGGGFSVYAPFTWTLGATYTLRVQADTLRGTDWWRFDVVADATGTLSYIGSVQVPAAWGDIAGAFALAFSEWFTRPTAGTQGATSPSSVMGGGHQNAGAIAPAGVGHQWHSISGGDICGFHASVDGITWTPSNQGILEGYTRIASVEGSRTVANRIWALASTDPLGGAGTGVLLRGTYDPATGRAAWVPWVTGFPGTLSGGPDHPRQTGRLLVLDEANDTIHVGSTDGIWRVTISTQAVTQRALAGSRVSGLTVLPSNPNIGVATAAAAGTAPGVHRIANLRSGTVAVTTFTTLTDPQDLVLASGGATEYVFVAANTQGVYRWPVGADITTGWTNITGTYSTGGNGACGIDGRDGATLSAVKVVAANSGEVQMTNAGAYSNDGGATWVNESTSWTQNVVPWGETAAWWLSVLQSPMMLAGGRYDSTCPRIDPADPTRLFLFGRSGAWRSADSGATWRPTIRGENSDVGWTVAFDPTSPLRAYIGDGDWGLLASTDAFVGMPTHHQPIPDTGTGFAFREDNGKLAAAIGHKTITIGDIVTSTNPWVASPTWTAAGFNASCLGVAIGQNATGDEVLLTVVEGVGIRRKVGTAAPTTVSTLTTGSGNLHPRFCWPDGHTGTAPAVYCATTVGLLRSLDYGATWAVLHNKTNTREYTGKIVADPADPDVLYYTVDNNVAADTGLWKVTGASTGSPAFTRIGPTVTTPGPCGIHPTSRRVYLVVTADEAGGPRLYRSSAANPGAATSFDDLTDPGWTATVNYPFDLDVNSAGSVLVANKQGGYARFDEGGGGGLTSCLQIPRVTGFFGTPGYSSILGGTGGPPPPGTVVAQPLLLGLHRPTA